MNDIEQRLRDALKKAAQLPPPERAVVVLRYFDELIQAQAADALRRRAAREATDDGH